MTSTERVRIVSGRFAGETGRLLGSGPERVTVDLGVAIDGGSGVVVVPASAVREVERVRCAPDEFAPEDEASRP